MARSSRFQLSAKVLFAVSSLAFAVPLAAQSDNALTFLPSSINISVQQGHVPPPQDIQVIATKRNVNYGVTYQSIPPGLFSVAGQSFTTPSKFTVFFGTAAAGHYAGKVTVTAAASDVSNPSTDIPVVIDITALPSLSVAPNPVALTVLKDAAPSTQGVTVSSNGDPMAFTAAATGASGAVPWVTVAQSTNVTGTQNNVVLNIAPAGLAPGSYTGSLTLTPANSTISTAVPINLTVAAAAQLTIDNPSLAFVYQTGQPAPAAQTVNVSNASGSQLPYTTTVSTPNTTSNWLKVAASGTAPGPLSISVDPTGLVPGTYTGSVTLTATGIASLTATIQVQLVVSNTPLLTVSPARLTFQTPSNVNPQPQQVTVYSTSGAVSYALQLQQGTDWIFLVPGGAATPQGSLITVAPSILAASLAGKTSGTYTSKLIITSPAGAAIPTQTIEVPVSLVITPVATLTSAPAQVTFDVPPGTTAFQRKDVTISNSDTQPAQFTVSVSPDSARPWLFTTIGSGATPAVMSILVNPSALTANRTDAEVIITPSAGSTAQPLHIPVTVRITGQVTFAIVPTGAVSFTADPRSAVQTKTVHLTSDPASTDFIAQTQNPDWLQVSPAVGNTGASGVDLTVRVDPGALNAGVYSGTINVVPISGNTTPFQISVKLTAGTPAAITVSPANLTFNYTRGQAVPSQQAISVASGSTVTPFAVTSSTNNGNSSWLIPVVTSTTTPGTVGVKIEPSGLAPGTYTGAVVVTGQATSNGPQTVGVTLVVQDLPTPVITDIQNGASFQSTAAAPGLIITIRGSNMGPASGVSGQAVNGVIPTTVSDTRVFFDTTAAPVLYVSDSQVNAIVPYDVNGRFSTSVQVERFGVRSNTITLAVKDAQPGIFATDPGGRGQGAILNQDYAINGATAPASRGSVIQIFATGEGYTTPAPSNGKIIGTDLRKPVTQPVIVRIGAVNAEVTYYGSAPNLVSGAFQVNARVPNTIAAGIQPLEIQVGTAISQANMTVAVK